MTTQTPTAPASEAGKKRNCRNCANLDYVDDDSYEYQDGGYCCNKRQYRDWRDEGKHLEQLQDPDYLARSKRCFEARHTTNRADPGP